MANEYSSAELRLFKSLGMDGIIHHITPPNAYRFAIEEVFFKKLEGPNIEALRRGATAVLRDSKPYRMTPEFDSLLLWSPAYSSQEDWAKDYFSMRD